MSKFILMVLMCALCVHAGTIGLVVPGDHPNYTVQLPPDQSNNTGIALSNLLTQNPQSIFGFTSQTDSGPRNLIGYFDPILPALQVIWTTPYVAWVLRDEPNFERFVPPPPPTGCEVTGTCPPPPPPPGCEATHSCPPPPPPPVCLHDCHPPPPPTQVPESKNAVLIIAGLAGIAALRRRAH